MNDYNRRCDKESIEKIKDSQKGVLVDISQSDYDNLNGEYKSLVEKRILKGDLVNLSVKEYGKMKPKKRNSAHKYDDRVFFYRVESPMEVFVSKALLGSTLNITKSDFESLGDFYKSQIRIVNKFPVGRKFVVDVSKSIYIKDYVSVPF
jgi:hypothetical protein